MANRKNWLGILVIVLVFGMTVVGWCEDGLGGTDPTLNGTWDTTQGKITRGYVFNNGYFEIQQNGITGMKGTYTTSGNLITLRPTHINGTLLGLGSKWYTEIELTIYGMGAAFAPQTEKYSVSGNTMTFGEGKDKFSLTKK